MKTLKNIQISAILLFITVIIFTSFFGVYKKEDFRTKNIIKDYKLGMQFTDSIKYTATPKEEDKVDNDAEAETENKEEMKNDKTNLTTENYKKTKRIIEKRLKQMDVGEYKLSLDEKTGTITIKLQNNDDIHELEEHIEQKGVFTVIDKETEEVLLDNSDVKSAKVVYGVASQADTTKTTIYLQIDFNKKGAKILESISQTYTEIKKDESKEEVPSENEEETEAEDEEVNAKYVSVVLDGETLSSTYFGEKMSTGMLYIPITQASDSETLTEYVKEVGKLATIINNGPFPIDYEFEEEIVGSGIEKNDIFFLIAIPVALLLIGCIVLVCKFKVKGFIVTFIEIGYIALLILTIRYTNVIITIEGIAGVILFAFLNYLFNYFILLNYKNNENFSWKFVGKFALYLIPVYVVAIALAFSHNTLLNSLGMTMFWGSFCLYVYNLIFTRAILEMLNNK